MAEKTQKSKAASRKNLLYILWVLALVAVMVTAIIVVSKVTSGRNNNLLDNSGKVDSSSTEEPNTSDSGSEPENPDDPKPPEDDNKPVIGKINFIMPCANGTVIKKYTSDTIVFNSTLGAYMGHMGIDIAAAEGSDVLCVYDGVIESIKTTYLTGTTVIVDHGNNLKSVYNSIDANDALYEGAKVSQGDLIGNVTANNLQEKNDGPHLHFEVYKNGATINPEEYLIGDEK